jgi:hypothetical protein
MNNLKIFGLLAVLVSLFLVSQPSGVFAQRLGYPSGTGDIGSDMTSPDDSSDMGYGADTGPPAEGFNGNIGNEGAFPGGAGDMDGSENGPLGDSDAGEME